MADNELFIPPEVSSNPEAEELLRLWVWRGQLAAATTVPDSFSLKDFETVFASLANHLAAAAAREEGTDQNSVVQRIVEKLARLHQEHGLEPEID